MPSTITSLLADRRLNLKLVVTDAPADSVGSALDETISWVHNSDLVDPTPFLDAGQLLLTDGTQFPIEGAAQGFYDDYVVRLAEHGIRGLGFATQIIHQEIPEQLELACRTHRLTLLEVPDRTPFIAIIRHVADVVAHEQNARMEWSLQAQRAIARAALRADGLKSILSELERQLGGWVALFDAAGNYMRVPTEVPLPPDLLSPVSDAAQTALKRAMRSGSRLAIDDQEVTLQTLGQRNQLRGVLAIGGIGTLDPAGNDLINSVIALASLALEQNRALDTARGYLRAGVFEQLSTGNIDVAVRPATEVWGGGPAEPLLVTLAAVPRHSQFMMESLEVLSDDRRGAVFFAEHEENVVVLCNGEHSSAVRELLGRHGATTGTSGPVSFGELVRGLSEAERALQRAIETGIASADFTDLLSGGMLGVLREENAGAVARGLVQPLIDHDERERTDLLGTTVAWFDNNCGWDQTAKLLGVHRHTLRNRIDAVGRILDLDLDLIHDRFELWTALTLLDSE